MVLLGVGSDHHNGSGVGVGVGVSKDNHSHNGTNNNNHISNNQRQQVSQAKPDNSRPPVNHHNGPVKLPPKFPVKWEITQSNAGGRGGRGLGSSQIPSQISLCTIDDAVQWVIQRHVPPLIGKEITTQDYHEILTTLLCNRYIMILMHTHRNPL